MNQKPVDDKELNQLRDILGCTCAYGEAYDGKSWNNKYQQYDNCECVEKVPELNAHYQKKYIGLIEKAFSFIDFEDKNEWIPPEQIREAIANIGGDLG